MTCTAAASLLLIPFLHPYATVAKLYGMTRTRNETMSFSALPSDWLVASHYSRFYTALHNSNVDAERWLFPGALSLLIGAIGMASTDRKSLKIALLWIGIGFAGSLGLHFVFHRFLFSHVPGFRAIRVPARWAAIAYVGLGILVAIGTLLARYTDTLKLGPWPRNYLLTVLGIQFVSSALVAGNATAISVRAEVINRTLDFQRIAALSGRQQRLIITTVPAPATSITSTTSTTSVTPATSIASTTPITTDPAAAMAAIAG